MLWLERHSGLVKVKETLVYTCGVNMQECSSAERPCVRVVEEIISGETKNMVERNEDRHNVQGNIGHRYKRSASWRRKKNGECFVLA